MDAVARRIRQTPPADLQHAWHHLNQLGSQTRNEEAIAHVVAWIARHGERQGFRPPNLGKRLRTTGAAAYL
eukprot:11206475-Lingulodinium_polyedra.AAC.1